MTGGIRKGSEFVVAAQVQWDVLGPACQWLQHQKRALRTFLAFLVLIRVLPIMRLLPGWIGLRWRDMQPRRRSWGAFRARRLTASTWEHTRGEVAIQLLVIIVLLWKT